MNINCPYSEHKKQGLKEYKLCTLIQQMCPFIRMCQNQNTVVHTSKAIGCELRLKESEVQDE